MNRFQIINLIISLLNPLLAGILIGQWNILAGIIYFLAFYMFSFISIQEGERKKERNAPSEDNPTVYVHNLGEAVEYMTNLNPKADTKDNATKSKLKWGFEDNQ